MGDQNLRGNGWKTTLIRVFDSTCISLILPVIIFVMAMLISFIDMGIQKISFFSAFESNILGASLISGVAFFLVFMCNLESDWHFLVGRIDKDRILIKKEELVTKVMKVFEKNEFFLNSDPIMKGPWKTITIQDWKTIRLTVHPVTENPKVRNINCSITVKIKKDVSTLQKIINAWGIERAMSWTTEIESFLYDFTEKYSIQLGRLFNPLNKEQQRAYLVMIHEFFDEKILSTGLVIEGARFGVG